MVQPLITAIFLVNSICMGLALTAMVALSALAAERSVFEATPFVLLPIVANALAARFFPRLTAQVAEVQRCSHGIDSGSCTLAHATQQDRNVSRSSP